MNKNIFPDLYHINDCKLLLWTSFNKILYNLSFEFIKLLMYKIKGLQESIACSLYLDNSYPNSKDNIK